MPGGWLQLICGPRPKSEQWPKSSLGATRQPRDGGGVEPYINVAKNANAAKVLEFAMTALGPEDGAKRVSSRAPVPEVTFEAARVRVQKLGSSSPSSLWQISQARKSMFCKQFGHVQKLSHFR